MDGHFHNYRMLSGLWVHCALHGKWRFPRIYALESEKKIKVAAKMIHNDVGFSLRRLPRDEVEMEQFSSLTTVLDGVVLPEMNDRWFWSLEGSGEYSVASARKFIDDQRLVRMDALAQD
ncbi:hypothetical protein Tco_1078254 [Tanacetum coccineum]